MTSVQKPKDQWTENEKFIRDGMAKTLPLMGKKFAAPTKRSSVLSYLFLNALFKNSGNADYFCEKTSRQTAQSAIKSVVRDMKSFREAAKVYKKIRKLLLENRNRPVMERKAEIVPQFFLTRIA